jgi:hypothetical protein
MAIHMCVVSDQMRARAPLDIRFPVTWDEPLSKVATGNTSDTWVDTKPTTPYGKVPVLKFKGVQIAHSWSINRFLARRFSMMGSSELEAAVIDATYEQVRTIIIEYHKFEAVPADQQGLQQMRRQPNARSLVKTMHICSGGQRKVCE